MAENNLYVICNNDIFNGPYSILSPYLPREVIENPILPICDDSDSGASMMGGSMLVVVVGVVVGLLF